MGRPHFPPCGGSPRPEEIRACPRVHAFDVGILGKSIAFGVTKNVRNKALRAGAPDRPPRFRCLRKQASNE